MLFVTWSRLFFCKQVGTTKDDGRAETKTINLLGTSNTLLQDITSTLNMVKNRKRSFSKQTCHVETQYFYVLEEF